MVATFEQLRTKKLKNFDELRAKPEPPDYGRVALPRERLPGVWDYDKQLDKLLGDPEIDIEDMLPLDVRYKFGQIVGMTEKPDETKDRMKSSLFYSIMLGRPPEVTFNLLDELNKIAFKKPIDIKKAMAEYSDYYLGSKNYVGAIKHGFRRAGAMMTKQLAGVAKMAGELTLPPLEERDKKVLFKSVRDWGIEQSEKLIGWSDMMLAAVEEYYRENKAEVIQITPGIGYWETLKDYITEPTNLVQGIVESSPLILEGILGNVFGGTAAAITTMSVPLSGEVYANARAEDTEVLPAMTQSILSGVGEAAIEQWTLSRKLGLMKNFKRLVADGLPKITWEGIKVFFRGTAEEGSQEFNRNFWRWVFTDRSQQWMENVTESMAAGGPMELAMAGVFSSAGYIGTPVSKAEQLDRIDKIQDAVDAEPTLTEEHKAEIIEELDTVREQVEQDQFEAEVAEMDKELAEIQKGAMAEAKPVAKAEPTKPKTIAEKEESELIERWAELDEIAKARRTPQQITELRQIEDELIKKHPPEAIEKDITDKARKKIIKETEEEIQSYDLYRDAVQAIEEQQLALPLKQYIIARTKDKIPGEIKDYIGKAGTKGYKGYLWKYLTTYEENPNAMGWDEALEQVGGRPGDIGEFIEKLDQVVQLTKGKKVISQQALDIVIGQGDLHAEIISAKYEMLKEGFSATEINDTLRQIGQKEDIDPEMIKGYYLPIEEVKYVRTKQEILRELLKESRKAKAKAKRPTLEEAAIKKAKEIAHKTKEPRYVYEKTGKEAGLFAVTKKPPTEGAYKKITPPREGKLAGEVKEEYAGLTPEEKASAKKLRQKIHAVAVNKGLTKKALSELKLKHTGYRHLTGKVATKKITLEQLQNLLKAVQRTRPKHIGYKKVVTLKTEKKIATLKENLQEKLQMTDDVYEDILDRVIGEAKEPKYISAKRFITEAEGKEIIKRMNNTAEVIRVTEGFEKAIRENREINAEVKRLDTIISKMKKRDPYTLESMRYYCQQCELKTGAPIFTMYMDLIDTHLETSKTRTATLKSLEAAAGKDEFRRISKNESAKQRIVNYIASKSKLAKKPPVPEKITDSEKKIAHRIQEIFKDKEVEVRFTKFYWWYNTGRQEGSFPMADFDRYKSEINKAADIYESKGKDELIEYLKTQEWGVIKSGYEPLEHITNKIKIYLPKSTTVGKSHIQIRTDIEYHRQERDIFQRLAAYLRQIDMLYNLSPKINAFVQLFEDNMDKFDNPKKVQESIEIFLRNLKRYNIQGGFFERNIARIYSQAMRTIIMPSPVLAYRNLYQNLAFEHDKSILIDTRNKNLTADEIAYLETYVQQVRGIVEEYFMVGEKPLPGLRTLTDLVDHVKMYPFSDVANRYWGFWAKINQLHRALEKETIKEMMKESRFNDITELEQRRALAILARDGKEAMAKYVSRVHVDDIHFLYERAQRSPAEMTTMGRTAGNLMLFPRSYGEKLAHASNKALKGKSYNEQWRGLKIIFSVVGGGMAVGSIFTITTGRKRNPYDPLQILSYQPGGLALGAITQIGKVFSDTLLAIGGDKKASYRLTSEIPRMADMFVPFYAYVMRGFESITDQKNVDARELRKIYSMIDKEYKIRGGAYKVRRNALEKWQYFLAGAGVDQEEKKKPKKITR